MQWKLGSQRIYYRYIFSNYYSHSHSTRWQRLLHTLQLLRVIYMFCIENVFKYLNNLYST